MVVGVEFGGGEGLGGHFMPNVGDVAYHDGEQNGDPCHHFEGEVGGGAVGDEE